MKLAIVDDQALLLKGLAMILSSDPDIEVVWTAESGDEALFKCENKVPDVALLDIRMPNMDGIELAEKLMKCYENMKCIMLTTFDEDDLVYRALTLGVHGFLLKESTPEQIVEAITAAYRGGVSITPQVAAKMMRFLSQKNAFESNDKRLKLTEREYELAQYVSEGLNNKEIAEAMFLSEGTVKNHLTQILNKLALRDRTQLAIWMLK